MRDYTQNIFAALLLLFLSVSSSAQVRNPNLSYALIATKNGVEKIYEPGSRLFLKYANDLLIKKCRGTFTGIKDGEIVIRTKKKGNEHILLLPGNIMVLRKINPGKRILLGAIGTVLVVGGAALIDNGGDTPGSAIGSAIVIPFIGAGVFVLLAIPLTSVLEKLNEKKVANGWKFEIKKQ